MGDTKTATTVGIWDVSRKITIPTLTSEADAIKLKQALDAVDGVRQVLPDTQYHRLVVHYDAATVDYQSIVAVSAKNGYPPVKRWWANLKGRWYQFTDSNSRENAKLPPPACCNKAPKRR